MQLSKEEQIQIKRFEQYHQRAYQRGILCFSNFLGLAEQSLIYQVMSKQYPGLPDKAYPVILFGGFHDAERKIAGFLPDLNDDIDFEYFPISCIKFEPSNHLYGEALTHRDFLGTVLGIGLERDQIGDILVQQEGSKDKLYTVGYVFCKEDKAKLLMELTRIRHTTVKTKLIESTSFHWEPVFRDIRGTVPSLRLDSVLSVALKTSRSGGLQIIREGHVYINGKCCTENAKLLQDGDVLSVRGYGKYKLCSNGNVSRKGRITITVKQYT